MQGLLTTEEVAEYLRVDVVTVRRLVGRGDLAAYRVGNEYRFKTDDVDQYLERQRVPAREGPGKHLVNLTQRAKKILTGSPAAKNFDKLTGRARSVLALAQDEAQRLNHNYLGTEHLLLALIREGEGVAARVLRELGVELEQVRREVEQVVGVGDQEVQGELCLTPRTKKVLELAVDEAKRLDHAYVGTEHFLLGLLREGEGVAARVLHHLGVDLETVRTRVHQVLSGAR